MVLLVLLNLMIAGQPIDKAAFQSLLR